MRKIYTIIAALLFTAGAFAQTSESVSMPTPHLKEFKGVNSFTRNANHEKTSATFWMDLDSADSFNQASLGVGYSRFAWESNAHYKSTDSVGGHYGMKNDYWVMFDTLVDAYNANGPTAYARSMYPTLSLDSVAFWVGQENNSGIDDTLVIQVVRLLHPSTGLANFPDTAATGANLYSSDTIFIPASAPLDPQYMSGYLGAIKVHQGAGLTNIPNTFAIHISYLGNKADSFMFVAGCPSFAGAGSCAGYTMADSSSYHPNSFYRENIQFHRIYPTTGDGFVYYECNGTNGFQYGVDGFDYVQNIGVYAKVTITTGILENKSLGVKLFQNMPNPFNNTTEVSYELAKRGNVTFEVTDLAGRVIVGLNEGAMDAGKHKITLDGKNFSQGVYFYTLNVDGVKLTNKMIVTK